MHFLVEQNDLNIRKGIDSNDREHMGVYKRPVFIDPDLQTAVQPVQHQRQDQIFACDQPVSAPPESHCHISVIVVHPHIIIGGQFQKHDDCRSDKFYHALIWFKIVIYLFSIHFICDSLIVTSSGLCSCP